MSTINKQKEINEIVKCGRDSSYFINKYVKIQHPTKGLIPFQTYPFQHDCLKDFDKHRFNIVLKSRQLGLSTLVAAYATWMAIFHKDKNILIIATKMAVAMNLIKKVKIAIKGLPRFLLMPEITADNKQSIEFSNGSSIKAVPTSADAGRSEALSILIIDEAAFIENFDTLWMGLYSTLSTGGRAIILSTPNGVGDKYHELYTKAEAGDNEFNPIKLMWDVHPDRNDEWLAAETRNMSQKAIAQELMCDFASSGDTYLTAEDLQSLGSWLKTPMEKWGPEGNVWVWKYPLTARKYIIPADVARGDGGDFSTFHVIDTEASEVVAEFRGKIPPDKFGILLAEAGRRYNNALLCPENNSIGYAVCMKLSELGYKNLYYANERDRITATFSVVDISKIGWQTDGHNRIKILQKLEEMLRNKRLLFRSTRLHEELKTFVWTGPQKAQAMKGYNDDLIMALAIGCWMYDSTDVHGKQSTDLNKIMLAGFAMNNKKADDSGIQVPISEMYVGRVGNVYMPIPGRKTEDSVDISWLIR